MNNNQTKIQERISGLGSNYAHDLRAPLSNIMGLIELLETNISDPLKAEIVKRLKISASALDTTTKAIIRESLVLND